MTADDDATRVRVRRAIPADLPAVARIHVRSWQVAYAGVVPETVLKGLDPLVRERQLAARMADPANTGELFVASVDQRIVGFVSLGPWRGPDADERLGEVYAIYVTPDYWARGAGSALLRAAVRRLAERRYRELRLWVLEGNWRARRFYESHGWSTDGERQLYEIEAAALPEVRYARPAHEVPGVA